jgi:hypothetical protein
MKKIKNRIVDDFWTALILLTMNESDSLLIQLIMEGN